MLHYRVPLGLVNGDFEKLGNAAHLAGQVCLEVGVVHHQHIGQAAHFPPGAHILPQRPEGVAVTLLALINPVMAKSLMPNPSRYKS